MPDKGFFLITGPTSGIGQALSEVLAQRGHNLILAARDELRLTEQAQSLKNRYPIEVETVSIDLSVPGGGKALYEACAPFPVYGLVNNAGMGIFGPFSTLQLAEEKKLLYLNLLNLHELCKCFLEGRKEGMLLNVASTAAFQSGPYMASYYASKAFVLSLTEALAEELELSAPQIIVSCLAPGPVATGFHSRANISAVQKNLPTAATVASYGVKMWFLGKVLIVPGWQNRVLLFLNRFVSRKVGRKLVLKNQLKKIK